MALFTRRSSLSLIFWKKQCWLLRETHLLLGHVTRQVNQKLILATSLRGDHYLLKYCVDPLSTDVYLVWNRLNPDETESITAQSHVTYFLLHNVQPHRSPLSQFRGRTVPHPASVLQVTFLLQKLDIWDGNAIFFFQNICFHSTHVQCTAVQK